MISKFQLIFIVTSLVNSCFGQSRQELDVQKIKMDIDSNCFVDSEADLSLYIKENPIEVFYSNEYTLVHIERRTEGSEAFMKQSTVLIYKWQNNSWLCLNALPYNYSIEQIDEQRGLFLSDNFICDNIGSCGRYIEIQKLENDTLRLMKSFDGFSNFTLVDGLLSLQKESEVKEIVGDTIEMDYSILNYKITESGKFSIEVKKSIKVLTGFNEYDILTQDSHVVKLYEFD